MEENQLTTKFQSLVDEITDYQNLCEAAAELESGSMDAMVDEVIGCLMDMHVESTSVCPCCHEPVVFESQDEIVFSTIELTHNKEDNQIRAVAYMEGEMFGLSDLIDVEDDELMLQSTISALRDLIEKFELRVKQA